MGKYKILLIEDDPNLGFILQEALELQNFLVTRCEDGEAGHATFLSGQFDLCRIDVMLPQKDGFSLAREIRKINQDIPLIFLTAKSLKEDRIEGFKIGGDDYISKPFSMEELILRIQAVLKRVQKNRDPVPTENIFAIGNYSFDFERRLLKINDHGQKLTDKESTLLRLLCLHQNQILEREVALNLIWGDDSFFNARSMDVYISKLRKYLKKDGRIEITNVHGKGFRLTVNQK